MVAKVFRIELQGNSDVEKGVKSLKSTMAGLATTIKKAKAELATLFATNADEAAIANLTKKIVDLEAKLKSLSSQRKAVETDEKRAADLADKLAAAKLKEAKATKEQELANKAKAQADDVLIASQIRQEKELDRQIAAEERQSKQTQKQTALNNASADSYIRLKASLAELRPFIQAGDTGKSIEFGGQQLNFNQAIGEYKKLSFAEQDFRRQFAKDGLLVAEYSSGIVQAFKQLKIDDIIKGQVSGAKQQLGDLEKKTQDLVVAYRQAQQSGSADLNKLEKEIHDNVTQTQNLKKAVGEAEIQLRGIGGVGDQITSGISKGFKDLKTSIGQFALSYIGFQAIFSGAQAGIENAKELSDQTSNLEVELGKAAGGADKLVDNLSKLDTRTKLTVLENIANIAAKAGVGEDNLVGVTQAIDKIKIAFGADFGDVEQGTESLVKLINIFLGPGEVTGDNLLKMGNAIRVLANESVASVPFLNDFSKRMAGLKGISDISLPSVLGLASGFEQFGQSAEVSSTALVKIIPKIANDTNKFAKIAGVTKEAFSGLLENNPSEALLKVSEGLVKGTGSLEEFASAFKDTELGTGRVEAVIGVLGKNSDEFRKSIDSAGKAFNDTSNIETAFAAKNENLAGTLDKLSKKFADAANGKAFQGLIVAISSVVLLLLNNLPTLIVVMGLLAGTWAVQNSALLLLRVQMLGYNIAIAACYVATGILTAATAAYNVVLFLFNGTLNIVTKGLRLFGLTVTASTGPLGVILTIVGLLGTALFGLSKALGASIESLKRSAIQQQINAEIMKRAGEATSDQISKIEVLTKVARDNSISLAARNKALQDLIAISPEYLKGLTLENITTQEGIGIINEYVAALRKKAALEAAQSVRNEKLKEDTRLQLLQVQLETQIASGKGKDLQDLTDEQKEFVGGARKQFAFVASVTDLITGDNAAQEALEVIKAQRSKIGIELDETDDLIKQKYSEQAKNIAKGPSAVGSETVFQVFERLNKNDGTKEQYDDLLKQIKEKKKTTNALSKEYKDLLDLEKKVRAIIAPKGTGSGRSSHLTGEQKDLFKEIDAGRDQALAEEKLYYQKGLETEKQYIQQDLDINNDALNRKIAILNAIKNKNAEHNKQLAELNLEKIKNQEEANKKLFNIDNTELENRLRNEEIAAKKELDLRLANPDLNNTDRLQAEQDYQDRLLKAQLVFNQDQIALEKLYAAASIENEQKRKEAIEKIINDINALQRATPEARQKDIQDTAQKSISKEQQRIAEQTIAILGSDDSYKKKAERIAALEKEGQKVILANQVAAAKIALDQAKKDYDTRLISEQDYQDKLRDYKEKEAALYTVTTNEQIKATDRFVIALKQLKDSFVESVLGIKQYTKDAEGEQARIEDAVNESLATVREAVKSAYNAYFERESQQIANENKLQQDAIDRQKDRVLATAESEAEKATIERQFAQKKAAQDKKAGEEQKKLAMKKATIDYALALIKTFAQFGFPLGLIPAAALTAAYLLQRSAISKQQFADGGIVQPESPGNGLIRSRSNIPALRNGDNVLATVKTGEVILNQDQQRRIGGPSVFRRIGVPGFAGGGVTGPQLGTWLRPPSFNAGYYSSGVNQNASYKADMDDLKAIVADVAGMVYASDQKEVVLNPGKVTAAQIKTKKNISVGTI